VTAILHTLTELAIGTLIHVQDQVGGADNAREVGGADNARKGEGADNTRKGEGLLGGKEKDGHSGIEMVVLLMKNTGFYCIIQYPLWLS